MRAASRSDAIEVLNLAAQVVNLWTQHEAMADNAARGIAAQVYDRAQVTASGHSDPTADAATTIHPDPIHMHRLDVAIHLHASHKALTTTVEHMTRFMAPSAPMRPRAETTTGTCQACERPVACTATDPLRGGHCNACRMLQTRWAVTSPAWNDNARFRRQVRADIQAGELDRPDSPHTPKHRHTKTEGGR